MNIVLKAVDAAVYAGDKRLVEPTSLELEAGRVLTILGETGSGKSLLAQAIAGLLPTGLSARGTAEVNGKSFDLDTPSSLRPLWGRTLGVLPQEPWLALDPTMRAVDQVAEGHRFVRDANLATSLDAATSDLAALGVEDAAGRFLASCPEAWRSVSHSQLPAPVAPTSSSPTSPLRVWMPHAATTLSPSS